MGFLLVAEPCRMSILLRVLRCWCLGQVGEEAHTDRLWPAYCPFPEPFFLWENLSELSSAECHLVIDSVSCSIGPKIRWSNQKELWGLVGWWWLLVHPCVRNLFDLVAQSVHVNRKNTAHESTGAFKVGHLFLNEIKSLDIFHRQVQEVSRNSCNNEWSLNHSNLPQPFVCGRFFNTAAASAFTYSVQFCAKKRAKNCWAGCPLPSLIATLIPRGSIILCSWGQWTKNEACCWTALLEYCGSSFFAVAEIWRSPRFCQIPSKLHSKQTFALLAEKGCHALGS